MHTVSHALRSVARHPWRAIGLSFGILLAVGMACADDYGLSMDEGPLFAFAQEVWRYLFQGGAYPQTADWKFHSPVYHMLFIVVMKMFPPASDLGLVTQRHVISFLTFCVGWWSTLFLARRVSGSWWWALLAAVWMALSPRIFAHAFYNPKDMPTLSFFALSMVLLVRSLERPTAVRILLFALAAAFTVSMRPFGLLLPAFAVLAALPHAATRHREQRRRWIMIAVAYVVSVLLLTIVVWPRLWTQSFGHLAEAFLKNVSRGDEGWYFGEHRSQFPWHYLFVWIGITTPVAYTLLFLCGYGVTLAAVLRRPLDMLRTAPVAAMSLLWVTLPILGKLSGRIGLFDEWRHVLFLYPAVLLLALIGAQWLWGRLPAVPRMLAAVLVCTGMASTALWMVRNHPLEYLYFSVPPSWVRGNVEMDYWGLSYREGLQWIAAHDDRPHIAVYLRDHVGVAAVQHLDPVLRARISAVNSADRADYIVDTLRWTHYAHVVPPDRIVHVLEIDTLPFLWIYRGPYAAPELPVYNYF